MQYIGISEKSITLDEIITTTTQLLDLKNATSYSIQCNIDVNTPAAKTFDNATQASLVNQGLTYTAVAVGTDGNDVSLELVDPAAINQALSVSATGNAITVNLATDGAGLITSTADDVKSAIEADSPGADDLVTITGSGAVALVVLAETNLSGGLDGEVSLTADTLSIPSHGFTTGLKGQLTTTGTLPTGVTTGVDYFVIVVDSNTIQLAASLSDAENGLDIDLTANGSSGGVNTFTATALAGASVKVQKSNDGVNWVDEAAATSITVDTTLIFEKDSPAHRYCQLSYTLTAGRMSTTNYILVKGYN